jgi:hypothetical protein
MQPTSLAALTASLCLAAGLAAAQTPTDGAATAPGAGAPPSLATNRGKVPHGHSHAHRAHAHAAPGKAAAPSVAENQGGTGAPSTTSAPADGGQGQAGSGGAASVSHLQNGTPQPK